MTNRIENELTVILILLCISLFLLYLVIREINKRSRTSYSLSRHHKNPLISPTFENEWENNGTFNPAAIIDDEGTVHLLYRAIGADGVSRVGYAVSRDGVHFEDRSPYPVFSPSLNDLIAAKSASEPQTYNPSYYTSGGGWGGTEDPRAVKIDGKVHMTYVAFGGWNNVRMALTSIEFEDLRNARWNWKKSVFLSPPGQMAKNWVLFPEKINGKFAILHGISPEILVDYVDDLNKFRFGNHINSKSPKGGRNEYWDNWVRGAGPPPLLTDLGWLLLYHAMDRNDPNKYKVGAMILDKNDPQKILFRSPVPILEPEMHYENDGKPGVVYATGAVIKDENLFVYYGGGDRHICVAHTPLTNLLNWLKAHGK